MTAVVTREVRQLAYRPNLSSRALYNCVVFLNQIKLTPAVDGTAATGGNDDDKDRGGRRGDVRTSPPLPASLIETYFKFFEVAVRVDDAASSKLSKSY